MTANSSIERTLKPTSDYYPIKEAIHARAHASRENPTSAEEFAMKLLKEINKDVPKSIIRIGRESLRLPLLKQILPEKHIDKILSKKFNLDKLR